MKRRQFLWGRIRNAEALDAGRAAALVRSGRERARRLAALDLDEILHVLSATGRSWADPAYPPRRRALGELPGLLAMDRAQVEATLAFLPELLDEETMRRRVGLELQADPGCLDGWIRRDGYAGRVRAIPRGLVLHVSAGNVFLGAVDSLLLGLLTKNAAIVKLASADPLFPLLFAESLVAHDPRGDVAGAVAVVAWTGGDEATEAPLKAGCDTILVWGGEESVRAYRTGRGLDTELVEFGPRISVALVAKEALDRDDLPALAAGIARDVSLWDQAACASPQVLYVEDPSRDERRWRRFGHHLWEALDEAARALPAGERSLDEKVEVTKVRAMACFATAQGEAELYRSADATWTVIRETDPTFHPSPLLRCLYVKVVPSLEAVPALLETHRDHLQSAGLACPSPRREGLATALCRAGVTRVTHPGFMLEGQNGSPHDGRYPMARLVRWVGAEEPPAHRGAAKTVASRNDEDLRRLVELVRFVRRRSPFYRERFRGLRLASWKDLAAFPLLTGEELRQASPPAGEGLLTGPLVDAVVYASGGSTGRPKYSYYSHGEFHRVCQVLAELMGHAGLVRGDRATNLFVAGHLWSSFNAVHKALELAGCFSIPLGGTVDFETMARTSATFGANVLVGLPSVLVELGGWVEAHGMALPIEKIFFGGEHVTPAMRTYFTRVFGARVIRSAAYASVDAGTVAFQCPHAEGAVHHVIPGHQWVEILDPESTAPVSGREAGEIVVTSLERRLMPIIRYRTGDLGRWIAGSCACGRTSPRFELLGRCDDRLQVGSARVFAGDVAIGLATVEGCGVLFQLVARNDGLRDRLELIVEREAGRRPSKALEGRIRQAVLERCPDLAHSIEAGWLDDLHVRTVAPGEVSRVSRTGKVRVIVDARQPS